MVIVPTRRMHVDELDADEALVRRLLAAQFPQWAELPIAALPAGGTDNAIFRLGDELSVRLPRRPAPWGGLLDKEFEWLPKLAPLLPLEIPTPVARGVPDDGYPHEWAIYNWLDGIDATCADLDLPRAAVDLAEFLAALRRIDPTGGPPPTGRGGPLRLRDEATRAGIGALANAIDTTAVTAAWEWPSMHRSGTARSCGFTATSTHAICSSGRGRLPVWSTGEPYASAIRPAT